MSETNGTVSFTSQNLGGLRGAQSADAGDLVRATTQEGSMGGSAYPSFSQGSPRDLPQTQTVAPRIAAQGPIGFSISLDRYQVEQAIKARALLFARAKGVQVPSDEIEFQMRSVVRWTEDGSVAVTLSV